MTKRRKRWLKIAAGLCLLPTLFVAETNQIVVSNANGRIFTAVEKIPPTAIGLVLGTSPRIGKVPNAFFVRRMDAAAELYRAGKVRKLLVSGDNGTRYYNEPNEMRSALIARGIPASDIVCDYAGFRTLDSIVRAHCVFGIKRCVIVTDDFHLPRALYIAQERGLAAYGYQTEPLDQRSAPWTYVREVGARSLVWLDLHVLNRQPKFTGPPEPIALPANI